MERYSTRPEAVERLVIEPLGEHREFYDIESIAAAVIDSDVEYRQQGEHRIPTEVFYYCSVDENEFWNIVKQNHTMLIARIGNIGEAVEVGGSEVWEDVFL